MLATLLTILHARLPTYSATNSPTYSFAYSPPYSPSYMLPTRVSARGGLEKLSRGPGSEIRLDVGLEKLRGLCEAHTYQDH